MANNTVRSNVMNERHACGLPEAYRVAATVSTRMPAARTTIHRAPELPPRSTDMA
jgi:hypothetical protein